MKNFIALCSFYLMSIFTCHSQVDPRVNHLEQLYWGQGAFAEIVISADSLSTYMELAENPLNGCIIDIYRSLAETHMSLSDENTIIRLQNAQQTVAGITGATSKYVGLALMAQAKHYTDRNPALAVENGDKALEILKKECPNQVEQAMAEAVVGYAYFFNGDGTTSEKLLTSSIELLKRCKHHDTWIESMAHANRSGAYIALRNGDAAIKDIGKSIDFFKDKDMDGILFQHSVLTFGMAVYVHSACGFYDNAITIGETFLENCEELDMIYITEYGNTLQNIGAAYLFKKNQKAGLEYYLKAKAHYEKFGYTDTDSYRMLVRNIEQVQKSK